VHLRMVRHRHDSEPSKFVTLSGGSLACSGSFMKYLLFRSDLYCII